ncbi:MULTISPECIES: hypothetical protein [unclassified Sphingomonas]|uniref:hypothetical protein n=1 Tax=unclassified Sphingomonas TaxID=196159 RepID=UPI001F596C15|nr:MULTISPECIES: hypothetical protein [unclassified Sphingomonas]
MMHLLDAGVGEDVHLPWATEPSALGSNECAWCGRAIYLPAVPCSTLPVAGLERMKTMPGQGRRCQFELGTRAPEILAEAGIAPID